MNDDECARTGLCATEEEPTSQKRDVGHPSLWWVSDVGHPPPTKLGYVAQVFKTGGAFDYKTLYGGAGWGADKNQFVDYGNWNYGYTCGALYGSGAFCQSAGGINRMFRAALNGHNPFGSGVPFAKSPYGDQAVDSAQIRNGMNAQASGCTQ